MCTDFLLRMQPSIDLQAFKIAAKYESYPHNVCLSRADISV